jgi:hypothetical protein
MRQWVALFFAVLASVRGIDMDCRRWGIGMELTGCSESVMARRGFLRPSLQAALDFGYDPRFAPELRGSS